MGAGVVVGDLFAAANVGVLWAEGTCTEEERQGEKKDGRDGKRKIRRDVRDGGQECPPQLFSAHALTGKERGELAEAAFLLKASSLGFGVAKPWGDSDRYDFILDVEGKLWRVQVKSAHRAGQDGSYSFRLHTHSLEAYSAADIDVLVAYVVVEDAWYVFPVRELGRLRSLKLFSGSRRKRSRFEKWREAWWVFGARRF